MYILLRPPKSNIGGKICETQLKVFGSSTNRFSFINVHRFNSTYQSNTCCINKDYTITIHTADESGAGTDGNVYIKFFGNNGNTDWMELSSSKNDFERDTIGTYTVNGTDVGTVTSIGFVVDENAWTSGLDDDWTIDYITYDNQMYKTTVNDYVGNVINATIHYRSSGEKDKAMYQLQLTDANKIDPVTTTTTRKYTTTIITGDDGTDAYVYIRYTGEKDSTEWSLCDNNYYDDFEKGDRDTYTAELRDVGTPTKIEIKLIDAYGTWKLGSIVYDGTAYDIDTELSSDQQVTIDMSSKKVTKGTAQAYGSVFSNASVWAIVAGAEAVFIIAAGIVIFLQKKKESKQTA